MIYPLEHNEGMNKLKHNEWFERLLIFQKIFGFTYRGYGLNAKERLFYLKKFLLCLYEIIVTILIFYLLWSIGNGSGDLRSRLYNTTSKKSLLTCLLFFGVFAAIVEQITCKSIIYVNGPQLLSKIHSFRYYLKPIPIWSKVKISLYISMYCSSAILGLTLTFNDFNSIVRDLKEKNFQILLNIFGGLIYSINNTSIVTLMTFTSDLVRREINDLTVSMKNNGKFDLICK
jgi:uncharacterized membrane protein